MRLEVVAAAVLLVSASPTSPQRVVDVVAAAHSPVTPDAAVDGRTRALARFRVAPSAPETRLSRWPPPGLALDSRPRARRYALIGGVVGFVTSALIARSISCPGSDCIDNAQASYPIVGVVFYGVIGGGAGALIGGGIGAARDRRDREGRARAGSK